MPACTSVQSEEAYDTKDYYTNRVLFSVVRYYVSLLMYAGIELSFSQRANGNVRREWIAGCMGKAHAPKSHRIYIDLTIA